VEYVLRIAPKLDDAVSRDILILLAQIEIRQTNRALGAFTFEVQVELEGVLFDFQPKLFAQRQ
jgi:hypothetical protein